MASTSYLEIAFGDAKTRPKGPDLSKIEEIYFVLGERIRAFRRQCDLTQEEFSDQVGLSRASIANIESGRQRIYLHDLDRMSEIFGIKLGDLIGDPQSENVELNEMARLAAENASLRKTIACARSALKEVE